MYIIAEIGMNYKDIAKKYKTSELEAIKKMAGSAKSGGADAIKLQAYKADKLASPKAEKYYQADGRDQYELFKQNEGFSQYKEAAVYCKKIGIDFLCACFDLESLEMIDPLVKQHKISSGDITNKRLIVEVAIKNKPIIMSTGGATFDEIKIALSWIKKHTSQKVSLLHCQIEYPCKNANLRRVGLLVNSFQNNKIGYSDHCLADPNMLICTGAFLMGADIIEKHFTVDKTIEGNDHVHSMDSEDIRTLKRNIKLLEANWICKDVIHNVNQARRSVIAIADIKKGELFTNKNIDCLRPGTGLSAKNYNMIEGYYSKSEYKIFDFINQIEVEYE